ncbi:MAG: DMT family transporter [Pseudomonadota bacterium]
MTAENPPRREALRGHAAMLAFSALVAGSFSLGGQAVVFIDPTAINAVRFAIAAALIGGVIAARGQFRAEQAASPWRYVVLGGLMALYFVTMFEALRLTTPVSTAAVFTLTPVISAIAGWVLLRQVTTPAIAAALAIGAAGALWVIFDADLDALLGFRIGLGETIFFFGVVGHGIYTPMVRRLNRGEPPLVFTFGVLSACCVVLLIYGAGEIAATDWQALPPIVWITILYVAIAASATTFFLLQYASLRLPSAKVMAYTYLTPSWVILWEGVLHRGWSDPAILPGIGATVVALALLLRDRDGA